MPNKFLFPRLTNFLPMKIKVVVIFLLFSAVGIRSEEGCRNIVRLNYVTVRDDVPSNTRPFPTSTGTPCDAENIKVLCSDTGYPDDIFCDVGRIELHSSWQPNSSVVRIELTYEHPSAEETYCKVTHTSGAVGIVTDFPFVGAECTPAAEDDALPPFRVSDLRILKITATTPRATYQGDECFQTVYHFGRGRNQGVVKGGANRARGTVKFDLNYSHCKSASTTFIGGRPMERAVFLHDGRRYRPGRRTTSATTTVSNEK